VVVIEVEYFALQVVTGSVVEVLVVEVKWHALSIVVAFVVVQVGTHVYLTFEEEYKRDLEAQEENWA